MDDQDRKRRRKVQTRTTTGRFGARPVSENEFMTPTTPTTPTVTPKKRPASSEYKTPLAVRSLSTDNSVIGHLQKVPDVVVLHNQYQQHHVHLIPVDINRLPVP